MTNAIVTLSEVENQISTLRGQQVILDSQVAQLYGIETKRVNEAVKNNPEKFPNGYIIETSDNEFEALRSKNSTLKGASRGEHVKYNPKAFTKKGLYMLATILKSERAVQTTISIVETFAKMRELSRTISSITLGTDEAKQKSLMQKGGEIFADLLDQNLDVTGSETSIELNLAVLKVKHTIKRKLLDK